MIFYRCMHGDSSTQGVLWDPSCMHKKDINTDEVGSPILQTDELLPGASVQMFFQSLKPADFMHIYSTQSPMKSR